MTDSFDNSLLRRAGIDSWDELLALRARSRPGEMVLLERRERLSSTAIAAALHDVEREQARLIASFAPDDEELNRGLGAPLIAPRITADLTSNAKVLKRRDGPPAMTLTTGLGLALQDALLSACCVRGFCVRRLEEEERPPAFPVLIVGQQSRRRYHDYRVSRGAPLQLLRQLPVSEERLALADLLFGLAYRWVMLHEQAHWVAGHLDFLLRQQGRAKVAMQEVWSGAPGEKGNRDDHCLELQADSLATRWLLSFGMADDSLRGSALASRYFSCVSHARHGQDHTTRFRVILLAIGTACLLMEVRRQQMTRGVSRHPPPLTRLVNVCVEAISTYGDIARFRSVGSIGAGARGSAGGNVYETALLRPALSELMMVLMDLTILARIVRLRDADYRSALVDRPGTGEPALGALSAVGEDIFSISTGMTRRPLRTSGARYFLALEATQARLWKRLAPFRNLGIWAGD